MMVNISIVALVVLCMLVGLGFGLALSYKNDLDYYKTNW